MILYFLWIFPHFFGHVLQRSRSAMETSKITKLRLFMNLISSCIRTWCQYEQDACADDSLLVCARLVLTLFFFSVSSGGAIFIVFLEFFLLDYQRFLLHVKCGDCLCFLMCLDFSRQDEKFFSFITHTGTGSFFLQWWTKRLTLRGSLMLSQI